MTEEEKKAVVDLKEMVEKSRELREEDFYKLLTIHEIQATATILNLIEKQNNKLEQLEKENEELNLKLVENAQEKYVEQNSVKPQDNFFDYYDEQIENIRDIIADKDSKYWLGENGIQGIRNILNQLERIKQDNFEIKQTYRNVARRLNELGNTELSGYMLAQINDVPTWTVEDSDNYISKQIIRDKLTEFKNSSGCFREIAVLKKLLEGE